MTRWDAVTLTGAVGCGAIGGVFFAFSAFVLSGLTRLPDPAGIEAMKSINITAVRPPLMIGLFGTAALCLVLAVRAVSTWGDRRAVLTLAGAVLYLAGAIVLTAAYNVPLNNKLADLSSDGAGAAAQWHSYAHNWLIANHVRALASLGALVLLVLALVQPVDQSRSPRVTSSPPTRSAHRL